MTLKFEVVEIDCAANPAASYDLPPLDENGPCVMLEVIVHRVELSASDQICGRFSTGGSEYSTSGYYGSTVFNFNKTTGPSFDQLTLGASDPGLILSGASRFMNVGYPTRTYGGHFAGYHGDPVYVKCGSWWRNGDTAEDGFRIFTLGGATMSGGAITVLIWYSDNVDFIDFTQPANQVSTIDFDISGAPMILVSAVNQGGFNGREWSVRFADTLGGAFDSGPNYEYWLVEDVDIARPMGLAQSQFSRSQPNTRFFMALITGANAATETQFQSLPWNSSGSPPLCPVNGRHLVAAPQAMMRMWNGSNNSPQTCVSGQLLVAR